MVSMCDVCTTIHALHVLCPCQADHMRVNHFHNHYELTRKDLLVKNVKKFKRALEKKASYSEAAEYDFVPTSFTLPQVRVRRAACWGWLLAAWCWLVTERGHDVGLQWEQVWLFAF
jgi:hypothetical protein